MGTGGRLISRTGLVLTEHPGIWPQSTPTALLAWRFSGVHAAIPVRARKPFTRLGDGEGRAAVRGPGWRPRMRRAAAGATRGSHQVTTSCSASAIRAGTAERQHTRGRWRLPLHVPYRRPARPARRNRVGGDGRRSVRSGRAARVVDVRSCMCGCSQENKNSGRVADGGSAALVHLGPGGRCGATLRM
jgi:hypothetical protein